MTDTMSEEYRHQCEVRDIIARRIKNGRNWAQDHLAKIEKFRGKSARDRLERDILQQWQLGNRGESGIWLVPTVA